VTICSVEAFFFSNGFSLNGNITLLVEFTVLRQTPTLPLPIFGVLLYLVPLTPFVVNSDSAVQRSGSTVPRYLRIFFYFYR